MTEKYEYCPRTFVLDCRLKNFNLKSNLTSLTLPFCWCNVFKNLYKIYFNLWVKLYLLDQEIVFPNRRLGFEF